MSPTLSVGTNARLNEDSAPTVSLMVSSSLGRDDLADAVLDLQHQLFGALDARAGRGADNAA